jgi:hypothetical protein
MFDLGYLSVDTRYRLRVSSRLRAEFSNGEAFYAKEGKVITLQTSEATSRTSTSSNGTWTRGSKRCRRPVRLDSRDKRCAYPAGSACLRPDLLACLASGRSASSALTATALAMARLQ